MLPAVFIVVPVLEIALLIYLSGLMGWQVAVAVVIVTGLIGAYLVRQQGTRAWKAIGQAFQRGQLPADELADGALVLVGGAFLLTPGLVTDVVGFSLMAPRVRELVRTRISVIVQRRALR